MTVKIATLLKLTVGLCAALAWFLTLGHVVSRIELLEASGTHSAFALTEDQVVQMVCATLQNSANIDFLYDQEPDPLVLTFLRDDCNIDVAPVDNGAEKRTI